MFSNLSLKTPSLSTFAFGKSHICMYCIFFLSETKFSSIE